MNFAKNEMAVIVARLFQQFDVELLTPTPHVVMGKGASHPSRSFAEHTLTGPRPAHPLRAWRLPPVKPNRHMTTRSGSSSNV
ncbi:MAG: hypothetical protein AAGF95_35335, partial [Chloroflexota bacterium]